MAKDMDFMTELRSALQKFGHVQLDDSQPSAQESESPPKDKNTFDPIVRPGSSRRYPSTATKTVKKPIPDANTRTVKQESVNRTDSVGKLPCTNSISSARQKSTVNRAQSLYTRPGNGHSPWPLSSSNDGERFISSGSDVDEVHPMTSVSHVTSELHGAFVRSLLSRTEPQVRQTLPTRGHKDPQWSPRSGSRTLDYKEDPHSTIGEELKPLIQLASPDGSPAKGLPDKDKEHLYEELNVVLQRRKEQAPRINVQDLEKMKTGKSIMYFGSSAQSPDSTRVRNVVTKANLSPQVVDDSNRTSHSSGCLGTHNNHEKNVEMPERMKDFSYVAKSSSEDVSVSSDNETPNMSIADARVIQGNVLSRARTFETATGANATRYVKEVKSSVPDKPVVSDRLVLQEENKTNTEAHKMLDCDSHQKHQKLYASPRHEYVSMETTDCLPELNSMEYMNSENHEINHSDPTEKQQGKMASIRKHTDNGSYDIRSPPDVKQEGHLPAGHQRGHESVDTDSVLSNNSLRDILSRHQSKQVSPREQDRNTSFESNDYRSSYSSFRGEFVASALSSESVSSAEVSSRKTIFESVSFAENPSRRGSSQSDTSYGPVTPSANSSSSSSIFVPVKFTIGCNGTDPSPPKAPPLPEVSFMAPMQQIQEKTSKSGSQRSALELDNFTTQIQHAAKNLRRTKEHTGECETLQGNIPKYAEKPSVICGQDTADMNTKITYGRRRLEESKKRSDDDMPESRIYKEVEIEQDELDGKSITEKSSGANSLRHSPKLLNKSEPSVLRSALRRSISINSNEGTKYRGRYRKVSRTHSQHSASGFDDGSHSMPRRLPRIQFASDSGTDPQNDNSTKTYPALDAITAKSRSHPGTLVRRLVSNVKALVQDSASEPLLDQKCSVSNQGSLSELVANSDTSSGLSELLHDIEDQQTLQSQMPSGSLKIPQDQSVGTSDMSLPTVSSLEDTATATTYTDYQQSELLSPVEYHDPGTSHYVYNDNAQGHFGTHPDLKQHRTNLSKSLQHLLPVEDHSQESEKMPSNSDELNMPYTGHNTDVDDGFATYPPLKSTRNRTVSSGNDQEIITNLMITHSGDRIPPEGAEAESIHPSSSRLTSNVTVPEPTSFHLHGNNVGKHFLSPEPTDISKIQHHPSAHHIRPMYAIRDLSEVKADYSDAASIDYSKFEYLLPAGCKHPLPQRVALDKEAQRYLLYYTWSSSTAKKPKHRHLRRIRHDLTEDDSDSSSALHGDHPSSPGSVAAARKPTFQKNQQNHQKNRSEVIDDLRMFCRSRNAPRSKSLGQLSVAQSGWCVPESFKAGKHGLCSKTSVDTVDSTPGTAGDRVSNDNNTEPQEELPSSRTEQTEDVLSSNFESVDNITLDDDWQTLDLSKSEQTLVPDAQSSDWVSCYVDMSTQSTSPPRHDPGLDATDWSSDHSVTLATQTTNTSHIDDATLSPELEQRLMEVTLSTNRHITDYRLSSGGQIVEKVNMSNVPNRPDLGSEADTESLYQDYDEYEESLIRYVKPEVLCHANENIKSLYRAQLDGNRALTMLDTPGNLLQRLTCCFLCQSQRSSLSGPAEEPPPNEVTSKTRLVHRSSSATGRPLSRLAKANRKRQQEYYNTVQVGSWHGRVKAPSQGDDSGTPITQTIMDSGSAGAYGEGLKFAHEAQTAEFFVDTQGRKGNLDVQVDGPNSIAKVNIKPMDGGKYKVSYVPVEVGIYSVNIRWNGRPIEGSPYRPRVVNSRMVHPVGGWEAVLDQQERMRIKCNQRNRIDFETKMAGPGEMRAEIKGPDGLVPVDVEGSNGGYSISFIPRTPGDYYIKVFWGEVCLSRCPIYAIAASDAPVVAVPSHDKVVLTGHGLVEARVQDEAEFVIDGTEAGAGEPRVTLSGVKSDIDVRCIPLGGNKYKCVYVPALPGAYLLSIMWSDRQVRGSPFKVNVSASSDASKVSVSGEGIRGGVYGKEIKAVIDTRRAGPGELTAHCMGPQKVAYCELYDHRDGTFTLNIKPQESGKHLLQVKYGGEHVPGSPFVLRVAGAPDASKVRVSGPGLEHGILATYQSRFIVETRGAGAGQLTVRIRGPKGSFRVEMSRESQKDRTILCRYDPTEVGDYVISIKWSGDHVPGSPFHVQIFDTNDEIERFMIQNPARRQNVPAVADRRWSEDL